MKKRNKTKFRGYNQRRNKPEPIARKIILFNKPFGVLCQFSPDGSNPTLKDYIDIPDFYPAGRLDKDSEGLLVLTDDGQLQHEISHPLKKLPKTYIVQLDGEITNDAVSQLESGIELKDGLTRPAITEIIPSPKWLWPRSPPVRTRQSIPTSWVKLQIREGKNRQVRRMTAAAGFPTLRLIRYSIGSWTIDELESGKMAIQMCLSDIKTLFSVKYSHVLSSKSYCYTIEGSEIVPAYGKLGGY